MLGVRIGDPAVDAASDDDATPLPFFACFPRLTLESPDSPPADGDDAAPTAARAGALARDGGVFDPDAVGSCRSWCCGGVVDDKNDALAVWVRKLSPWAMAADVEATQVSVRLRPG